MVRRNSFLFLFFFSCMAVAAPSQKFAYYGKNFSTLKDGHDPVGLRKVLAMAVGGTHALVVGDYDRLGVNCEGGGVCYRHQAIGYKNARAFIFGDFYLVKEGESYGVKDVYCQRVVRADEFSGAKPGPNIIPDSRVVNAEHTWPQSQFNRAFPGEDQKSDLHHLFPTDSELNSKRSSLRFGVVDSESQVLKCSSSRLGQTRRSNSLVFEPPAAHKGNVARALFYFSVRYNSHIDAEEEATLREWNEADPVDEEEVSRNERIFQLQKNRNPFVDFPELAEKIADF